MRRIGRNSLILMGIGLVAVLVGAQAVPAEDGEGKIRTKDRTRIVVIDDDGNRHEETFEFDGNHPRPFLGVNLGDADGEGARVEEVIPDTAAERGGLREGDVIVGFDGTEIGSSWDLTREVLRSETGKRVDVEVIRDGRRETVNVELGERDDWIGHFGHGFDAEGLAERMGQLGEQLGNMDFHFEFDGEGFAEQMEQLQEQLGNMNFEFDADELGETMEQLHEHLGNMKFDGPGRHFVFRSGRPLLGVELVDVTPELREHLGADGDEGVLIGRVLGGTPAEAAGVEVGDLIVAIDGERIEDAGDLRRALKNRRGETFGLDVIRDGLPTGLTVTLPEPEDDEEGGSGSGWRQLEQHRSAPSDADRS